MEKDIAIKVEGISKNFKIPHEKISSLRGAFVNLFRSNGYEEFKALDDVSFEVKKGEFFGIIGRNGSGKSTLLKILAGIYQPDGGKIKINGLISPFLELGIGFNPELSGRDNIFLNAAVLGLTKKQIDEKFDDIVNFSELRRFIDQKVKNYSSGMQVRLAFSVAIHANRDILLMDEVLAVGDSNFQVKCIEEFKKEIAAGKTVVLVTHSMDYVEKFCNRAMFLANGKIKEIGATQKTIALYQRSNVLDEESQLIENNKKIEDAEKEGKVEKRNARDTSPIYRTGTQGAVIKNYKVLDHTGRQTFTLYTGKHFSVEFEVEARRNLDNLAFTVIVRNDFTTNLLGVHNIHNNNPKEVKNLTKGETCHIKIENIPVHLNPGAYYLTLSCATHRTVMEYELLDSLENMIKINVAGIDKYFGTINTNEASVSVQILKGSVAAQGN